MKLKFILIAGIATAALSGTLAMPALAGSYDDQVEETRALNIQALEDARSQNGFTMPLPPSNVDDEDEADGQGGPSFDGPPGPDDMGTDDGDYDETDSPDDSDGPDDTLPPDTVE
jgi:hypothetical protein